MAVGDPNSDDRHTIVCLYCEKPQEVGRRAMTITCRFCSKRLVLEDIDIKDYQAKRAVETVGIVIVEKKGAVVADRILCGGLVARGRVQGAVTSRGPVLVGPEASLKGDVTAPTIAIGAGAVLQGHYEIGTAKPPAA